MPEARYLIQALLLAAPQPGYWDGVIVECLEAICDLGWTVDSYQPSPADSCHITSSSKLYLQGEQGGCLSFKPLNCSRHLQKRCSCCAWRERDQVACLQCQRRRCSGIHLILREALQSLVRTFRRPSHTWCVLLRSLYQASGG